MARERKASEPAPGTPEQEEEESTVEEPGAENEVYTFNPDDIVKRLPDGWCLCPMCLGMMAIVEDPPMDPRAHVCDVCRGHGELRTGSLLGAEGQRKCWACNGLGWQEALGHEPDALPARPEFFSDGAPPARDVHGRTPDDPDFDWARVVVPTEPQPAPIEAAALPAPAAATV